MGFRAVGFVTLLIWVAAPLLCAQGAAQTGASSSSSPKHVKKLAATVESGFDAGVVTNGVYRNKALAVTCKIPEGWVLRTEEMNAGDEGEEEIATQNPHPSTSSGQASQNQGEVGHPDAASKDSRGGCPHMCSKVLLAALSRPPEVHGEDVNASILIAVESVAAYPGLKEAVQYFGPLTEVAKAQGFTVDEEPYELALGSKVLVRSDFHKDVGTRVMRQSSLVFLAQGYAVSITVIGGTEDEVEELIDGVEFGGK